MTYAMLACLLYPDLDCRLRRAVEAHPHLIAYEQRMRERYCKEFQTATASAS